MSGRISESNWVTSTIRMSSNAMTKARERKAVRLLFLLVGAGELPPVAGRPSHRVEFGGHFFAHARLGAAGFADHVALDGCHPVEVHPAYRRGTDAVRSARRPSGWAPGFRPRRAR